jgi:hypothetical protein
MNKRQYKKYIFKKYPGARYKGLKVQIKNIQKIMNMSLASLGGVKCNSKQK